MVGCSRRRILCDTARVMPQPSQVPLNTMHLCDPAVMETQCEMICLCSLQQLAVRSLKSVPWSAQRIRDLVSVCCARGWFPAVLILSSLPVLTAVLYSCLNTRPFLTALLMSSFHQLFSPTLFCSLLFSFVFCYLLLLSSLLCFSLVFSSFLSSSLLFSPRKVKLTPIPFLIWTPLFSQGTASRKV